MLRTHCLGKERHPLTPDNVVIMAGRRNCKACANAREKRWRDSHVEKVRAGCIRWRANNREKYLRIARFARHVRRIRAIAGLGSWTLAQWESLKASFNNRCLNCGLDEAQLAVLNRTLSPDHVRPLAKEGTNDLSNIQPLCHGKGGCNNRKHTKWIDYRGGFSLEIC
jgi:hypothetical protein